MTALLHCIWQPPAGTSRLVGCYLNAMRRSTPQITMDPPHYSEHFSEAKTSKFCSFCWTTMQMYTCTTTAETLHCIWQLNRVSSRLLRKYLSAMRRSTPGLAMNQLHFCLH